MQIVPMRVAHSRTRPRRNAFRYAVCYFAIPLREMTAGRKRALFSIDRANLFSLRTRDYGDGRTPPQLWVRRTLDGFGLAEADGEITLLTLPRILGYAFNPVSFWFCRDRDGALRAVLTEVNNTFGERHCYLCVHGDHRAIACEDQLEVRKVFHVSPFLEVKGEYRFHFACDAQRIAVHIDLHDEDGLKLSTAMGGRPRPLTDGGLLKILLGFPLQSLKVIVLIHYQAAKLYLKGVRPYRKPAPPAAAIT